MLSRPFHGTSFRAAALLALLCTGASPAMAQDLPPGAVLLDIDLPEGLFECATVISYVPIPDAISIECQENPLLRVDAVRRTVSKIADDEERTLLTGLSDGTTPLTRVDDDCRAIDYADPDAACAIATFEDGDLRGWIHDRSNPGAGPSDPSLATATILRGDAFWEFYAIGLGDGGGSAEIRRALPTVIEFLTPPE